MTFDARTAPGEKKSGNRDVLFGAAVLCIVGGAFFVSLMMFDDTEPQMAEVESSKIVATAQISTPLPSALDSPEATSYFKVLRRVDEDAHAGLMKKLKRASRKPAAAQFQMVQAHAQKVLKDHAVDLSKARTRNVDRLLVLTQKRLKEAARSKTPWCSGAQYAGVMSGDMSKVEALGEQMTQAEGPLQAYSLEMMSLLMEAILEGRSEPMQHGPVTTIDEAALQGVMMSLISEPQIVPILMAANTGADPEPMIKALNVCDLGATAIVAVKTLPQDTKGRVWSQLVKDAELGGADLRQLNGVPGF
jgi:hypothetical protein